MEHPGECSSIGEFSLEGGVSSFFEGHLLLAGHFPLHIDLQPFLLVLGPDLCFSGVSAYNLPVSTFSGDLVIGLKMGGGVSHGRSESSSFSTPELITDSLISCMTRFESS